MVNVLRGFSKRIVGSKVLPVPPALYNLLVVAIVCFVFVVMSRPSTFLQNYTTEKLLESSIINRIVNQESLSALTTTTTETSFNATLNAQRIKLIRQQLKVDCDDANEAVSKEVPTTVQMKKYTLPASTTTMKDTTTSIRQCTNVIMDFGANIGDTLGKVVDAGLIIPSCGAKYNSRNRAFMHFDVETKQFTSVQSLNRLSSHLHHLMASNDHANNDAQSNEGGPEDYCYYGIEGNPVFTERLHQLETYVMSIEPRPVQHAHFFTESVGSGEDGMTKLYLDTVNTKQNFWGSSIFKDHQDVRKSVEGKDAESTAVPVMGYTIGTLMRKTFKAFDPNATEEEKKGGHFILKVDIEGGEYPLLNQAVEDGTLCEFVTMGNKADIFIEFHSVRVTGKHDYVGQAKRMKDALTSCGVSMGNLGANWH